MKPIPGDIYPSGVFGSLLLFTVLRSLFIVEALSRFLSKLKSELNVILSILPSDTLGRSLVPGFIEEKPVIDLADGSMS